MTDKLNPEFLLELFKFCTRSKELFEIVRHYLKYNYLPEERFKKVWKFMLDHHELHNIVPSIGIIAQEFNSDKDVNGLLVQIKNANLSTKDAMLTQLEEYVKQAMFVDYYDKFSEAYNRGERAEAYNLLKASSEEILSFSIRVQNIETIFTGFEDRQRRRKLDIDITGQSSVRIPFGIDALDFYSFGGIALGDTALFLAQSGIGKTKLLRHIGVHAARQGFRVIHFQAEGTKRECEDGYDGTWTGSSVDKIECGIIDPKFKLTIEKALKDIANKNGEIFIQAFEQFDTASLMDIKQTVADIEKSYGKVHLILLDYFELFDPGDGKKYSTTNDGERARRRSLGRKLKNIAVELNVAVATATQASSVAPKDLHDPEFVMTRYNVSEFKSVIDPFSIFISLNQTKDERSQGIMRMHNDKIRRYASGQTYKIYQHYQTERFYDQRKTLSMLWDIEKKRPK